MNKALRVLLLMLAIAWVIDALYWVVHPLIPILIGAVGVLVLAGAWYRRKRWW